MNEDVPRDERGSQGQIARYLRDAYDAYEPAGDGLRLGPTDLDKIAMMLARPYSRVRALTLPRMRDDFLSLCRVFARAADAADENLKSIRASREP